MARNGTRARVSGSLWPLEGVAGRKDETWHTLLHSAVEDGVLVCPICSEVVCSEVALRAVMASLGGKRSTGSHACSPFCSGYFWRLGLQNYLPGLASNLDPPHLCLPISWDYRCEPPHPASCMC
jgi:hypothetical protein